MVIMDGWMMAIDSVVWGIDVKINGLCCEPVRVCRR